MRDQSKTPEARKPVAFAGVRCAMLADQQGDAVSYLSWLQRSFPNDPDVLFLATHVYTELSARSATRLMKTAPDSPLVVQLNAEKFEEHGDYPAAIAEYRILLKSSPEKPGIHYRIGGLLMSSVESADEARKEFEAELKINPQSPGPEFYLGEIARQKGDLPTAIDHYSRAIRIYPEFADAQFGLGRVLLDSNRTSEAIPHLEAAVRLNAENPTMHLALATGYQRSGRKDDAARQFQLQKQTATKLNQNSQTLKKNVSGMALENDAH